MYTNLLVFLLLFSTTLPKIIDTDKEPANIKIIGGKRTNITTFPILVSIRYGSEKNHLCGGSVIRKRWVLTAGHCVCPAHFKKCINTNKLEVVAGSSYSSLEADDSTAVYMKVEKWFVSNFQRIDNNVYNDISLILLRSSLAFNARIFPVILPASVLFQNHPPWEVYKECTAVGWGSTTRAGKISINLRVVRLPLISFEECEKFYMNYINETDLCTLDDTGKDTCSGDSGGPLLCDGYVIGVCSRSFSCSWRPSIWTRVDKYLDWIISTIEKDDHLIKPTTDITTATSRNFYTITHRGILDRGNKSNGCFLVLFLAQTLAAK